MGAVATRIRTIETPEHPRPPRRIRSRQLFEPELVRDALKQSFVMLRPDIQWSNPVMFVVEIGAVLTLLFVIQALVSTSATIVPTSHFIALDAWLFLTLLLADFATAPAEARGKAQGGSLCKTRSEDSCARRLKALKDENRRQKQLLADSLLDKRGAQGPTLTMQFVIIAS